MSTLSEFYRPTLDDLAAQAEAAINARLPGSVEARLRWNNLSVLAHVVAGATHELFGYLESMAQQMMPDQATGDFLERHAAWRGVVRREGSAAEGIVRVDCLHGAAESVLPGAAGPQFRHESGLVFQLVDQVDLPAYTGLLPRRIDLRVRATEIGAAGNLAPGTRLQLRGSAIFSAQAVVDAGGFSGGGDRETDEALRQRLRDLAQNPPAGGSAADYVAWAGAAAGVARVWVAAGGLGRVVIHVLMQADDANPTGLPTATDLQRVREAIDPFRPVTAIVDVRPLTARPLTLAIALRPNAQSVRDAVNAELRDLLYRERAPGGRLLASHIREAISIAAGEADHETPGLTDIDCLPGEVLVWQEPHYSTLVKSPPPGAGGGA